MDDQAAGKPGIPEQLFELMQPGTPMGSARPKNVVEDSGCLWLAKFPDNGDKWNNTLVEGATLAQLLANELCRRSARSNQDLEELFRRTVFNALISNTDDHPRNHALIATTDKWELSPAYDLTPNPLTSLDKRDLAMTCGTFNRYANRPGADLSLQMQNIE